MKIAIIGLGLIGGSLGLCLKENKLIIVPKKPRWESLPTLRLLSDRA